MLNLESVKNEYLKNLKLSKIELEALDSRTRYSQEGVVNAAKQKLQSLRPQLMSLILGESTTVYIESGVDLSEQLNAVLSEERNSNVLVLDFNGLEKALAEEVYPQKQIKGYAFNSGAVSRLNNALVDVRTIIGATFIPPVVVNGSDYKLMNSAEEAVSHLQALLVKSYSNELKSLYLAKKMNDFTEKSMVDNNKMVFFVTGVNGNTKGLDQITGKTVFITAEDEIPTDASGLQTLVTGKLRQARKNLTKNNSEL